MLQAIVINSSRISLPTCCTNLRYQSRSINSGKCTPLKLSGRPENIHISRIFSQCQNRCLLVSTSNPHASHIGLSKTFWWQRLALVGSIFQLVRHAKFLILIGTLRLHRDFQNIPCHCSFEVSGLGLVVMERAICRCYEP